MSNRTNRKIEAGYRLGDEATEAAGQLFREREERRKAGKIAEAGTPRLRAGKANPQPQLKGRTKGLSTGERQYASRRRLQIQQRETAKSEAGFAEARASLGLK